MEKKSFCRFIVPLSPRFPLTSSTLRTCWMSISRFGRMLKGFSPLKIPKPKISTFLTSLKTSRRFKTKESSWSIREPQRKSTTSIGNNFATLLLVMSFSNTWTNKYQDLCREYWMSCPKSFFPVKKYLKCTQSFTTSNFLINPGQMFLELWESTWKWSASLLHNWFWE